MTRPRPHAIALLLLTALLPAARPARAQALPGVPAERRPQHAAGLVAAPGRGFPDASVAPALPPDLAKSPGKAWALVEVPWERAEPEAGRFALEPFVQRIDEVVRAGGVPVLALAGGHPAYGRWTAAGFEPPAGADPAQALVRYRAAWLAFVRAAVRAAGGRVPWVLVDGAWPAPGAPDDARLADYEIKAVSVTVRGEEPGIGIALRVAGEDGLDLFVRALHVQDNLLPYVDAIEIAGEPVNDATLRARMRDRLLAEAAGVSLWTEAAAGPGLDVGSAVMEALSGFDLVFARTTSAAEDGAVLGLARALGPAFGRAPAASADLEIADASVPVHWAYFFDDEAAREMVLFWPAGAVPAGGRAALVLDARQRRGFQMFDPAGLGPGSVQQSQPARGKVRLDVVLVPRPVALVVQRVKGGGAVPDLSEASRVSGTHRVTAEEVIAAHQAWRAFQDERLQSVARDGEISFRVRFAQVTGTFDLTVKADYLWDRAHGADWAIRGTYFNGVKLDWDKFPEVPFVSRERVVALPLTLDFDKRYAYTLDGTETIEGHACWRVRFTPLGDASLVRGRAWIDQRTAALVRVSTIQTKLKPPMISDEETQTYHPVTGPDGTTYWLLDAIDGQQIYTVSGSNLVVLRAVRFGAPRINDPRFEELRAGAYASPKQMIRETPEGYKWLTRTPNGERKLLEKGNPRQWFAVLGAFRDEATDGVLPIGGINYTDIDFRGKGGIFNVFFAGPLLNVTLSQPGLFGTRMDGSVNVNAVGFAGTDKQFVAGRELVDQRLRTVEQSMRLDLGLPISTFLKAHLESRTRYVNYHRDETTGAFIVPADHFEQAGVLDLTYDRAGWGLLARGGVARRARWDAWGPESAPVTGDELERTKGWRWYTLGMTKSVFLPFFQKLDFGATYQAGRDLDRFSAFQFGPFSGARVRGFGGAGIRYDRGLVVSAGYSFNIGEVVRFDAGIDQGRVHDPAIGPGMTNHTGVGLAANFLGPYRTIVRLDAGYALRSDLASAKGGKEFTLIILRLF